MGKTDDAFIEPISRTSKGNRRWNDVITGCHSISRSIRPVLGAVFVVAWFGVHRIHLWIVSSMMISSAINVSVPSLIKDSQVVSVPSLIKDSQDAAGATEASFMLDSTSSWYGWQPMIHPEPDCSWRKCFEDNHGCRTTCRDEPEAMENAPSDIPHDWVPDVTMLRQMFLAQTDADGNPWPPPLSKELCEPIGEYGDRDDSNKELFDAVPIAAEPLNRTDGGPTILCMIYTMASAHAAQVRAIRETWAGGCDGYLAFSTESDPRIPAISIPHDGVESYDNMWQKVRSIWRFVGEHYANDFDYFILGGDDLFVLPQNLRSYLATVGSPDELTFAGRRFKGYGSDNYFNSGGAGYTLSRGTLKLFAKEGLNDPRCAPNATTFTEDVIVAKCLRLVFGIGLTDTRDAQGRERFHPFSPGSHFYWTPPKPGEATEWYQDYNKEWGVKLGAACCAPDSVSFHYLNQPAMVRHIFALLYDSNC